MSEPIKLEFGKRYKFRVKTRSSEIGVHTLTNNIMCCCRATDGLLVVNSSPYDTIIIGTVHSIFFLSLKYYIILKDIEYD